MVLEEIHILGHLIDLFFDLLELGLQIFEIAFEVQHLLITLLLIILRAALSFLEHSPIYTVDYKAGALLHLSTHYLTINQKEKELISFIHLGQQNLEI